MWKQLLILLFVGFSFVATAQGQADNREKRHERIRQARQAFITEQLELTTAEAEAFFSVFWDFQRRLDETRKKVFRGRRSYAPDRGISEMTEAEAKAAVLKLQKERMQVVALSVEAENRYLTILPAKKVLRLELAERAFRKKLWERMGRERGRH